MPIPAAITWATVFTVANYALTVYGLYRGYRMHRAAKRAYDASLTDRTVSITASDLPRATVYGRRIIGGTPVYIVEPRDAAESVDEALIAGHPPRPANEFFYAVLALEAGHEIDAVEEIYLDNEPLSPYFGNANPNQNEGGTGFYVGQGSKFYKSEGGTATTSGTVAANGTIAVPGVAITKVLNLGVTKSVADNLDGGVNSNEDIADPLVVTDFIVTLGVVQVSPTYAGRKFVLTYEYQINQPMVRVWVYRGRDPADYPDQVNLVNPYVQAASGGEWNSFCRLIGCPYIVLEIRPDLKIFPNGFPVVTVRVRGKRCLLPTGGKSYSENPVVHLYDYLRSEYDVQDYEIDIDNFIIEANECNVEVVATYKPVPVGVNILPMPIYTPRYTNHAILASDVARNDNLRIILSSMAGSITWAAGKFQVLAGVPHNISPITLNDRDLADDNITVKPEPSVMEGFNCVRGRFSDESQKYAVTDFPPYKSPTYIEEDRGANQTVGTEMWMELDLPGVTNVYQAQRIALLKLRLNRNALSFTAHYKGVVATLSAGDIVNINNETFGWYNKPFHLVQKKRRPDRTFETLMIEAALPIYSDDYREATSEDPSPNTRLTLYDQIPMVTGLTVISGPGYADLAGDQSLRAFAFVTWDRLPASISYGGQVELWYIFAGKTEWQKFYLPGDAVNFKIRVQRGQQFTVQVRAVNGIQIGGNWSYASHMAIDAPTEPIVGSNLLQNAEFQDFTQTQRPDTEYSGSPFYIPFWYVTGGSPTGGVAPLDEPPNIAAVKHSVEPTPGNFVFRHTGIATWVDRLASGYRIQRAWASPVAVTPGSRMLAVCRYQSAFGRGRVGVKLSTPGQSSLYDWDINDFVDAPPRDASIEFDYLDPNKYQTLSMFFWVPPQYSVCQMYIQDTRPADLIDASYTVVALLNPMLTYASVGQISIPPWTK